MRGTSIHSLQARAYLVDGHSTSFVLQQYIQLMAGFLLAARNIEYDTPFDAEASATVEADDPLLALMSGV